MWIVSISYEDKYEGGMFNYGYYDTKEEAENIAEQIREYEAIKFIDHTTGYIDEVLVNEAEMNRPFIPEMFKNL